MGRPSARLIVISICNAEGREQEPAYNCTSTVIHFRQMSTLLLLGIFRRARHASPLHVLVARRLHVWVLRAATVAGIVVAAYDCRRNRRSSLHVLLQLTNQHPNGCPSPARHPDPGDGPP